MRGEVGVVEDRVQNECPGKVVQAFEAQVRLHSDYQREAARDTHEEHDRRSYL